MILKSKLITLDKFTEANYLNEKFFEDFDIYMFQIGMLMHLKVDRGDIKECKLEMHMPKRTILRGKSHEQYYSTL
jgi:hypothetical protein